MSSRVGLPEAVRQKARALGADGERWLEEIGDEVTDLARTWGLRVGPAIEGGSGGFVAHAETADGTQAVLKIAIPDGLEGNSPFATELETLVLGAGRGYVRVLRVEERRRAMLQERLGRPMSALGLAVEAQIDAVVATLTDAWRTVPSDTRLRTGAEQAQWLREFIRARWEELGRPCPRATIERADEYALARRDAFDAATAVMIHGDAHPANVLEDPGVPGRFKLIDPDGMRSEPAHDLAIPLRDWTDGLLASGDPLGLGRAWCARLAARAGVDAGAIWQWAFVERVSTGLFLMQLGDPSGARFLEVAARWTDETR